MSELRRKKTYAVPDWMFKSVLILAAWLFTIVCACLLLEGMLSGRIEARGSAVYTVDQAPVAYASYMLMLLVGEFALLLAAVASLGFVPFIGRIYKRLYGRLLRSGKDSAPTD